MTLEVCVTVFMCLFLSKTIIVCYYVDGENTHGANESVSSSSSLNSKHSRGDTGDEQDEGQQYQEEECANSHKRHKSESRQEKSLRNLRMTGGYINHSLNVGQRRVHKPA